MPSPSSSPGSSSTTSGRSRARSSGASAVPVAAPTGTNPGSPRSSSASPARTAGWGSTTAMRVMFGTVPAGAQPDVNVWGEARVGAVPAVDGHRPAPSAALELRGLAKRYDDGLLALDHVDLTIRDGEFFGLLGPNGAGK